MRKLVRVDSYSAILFTDCVGEYPCCVDERNCADWVDVGAQLGAADYCCADCVLVEGGGPIARGPIQESDPGLSNYTSLSSSIRIELSNRVDWLLMKFVAISRWVETNPGSLGDGDINGTVR